MQCLPYHIRLPYKFNREERTDWHMSIRRYWKLFDDMLVWHLCSPKLTSNLTCSVFRRSIRCADLNSMIGRAAFSGCHYISSDLAIVHLDIFFSWMYHWACKKIYTWSTVTGNFAPCWSHIAVIPRFLAMSPVLIDWGVHLTPGVGIISAFRPAEVCNILRAIANVPWLLWKWCRLNITCNFAAEAANCNAEDKCW